MKKSKKILLACSVLSPILLLSACTTPPSHLITASPSENLWGSISGITNTEMQEGTRAKMTAVEFDGQNHPFVCWIKGNSKIFSTDKSVNLEYNDATAGHYTALFDDQPTGMRYSAITAITFSSSEYTNIDFSLNYSSSISGSNNYFYYTQGSTEQSLTYETDKQTVLYFGSLSDSIEYKFEIKLTLTDVYGSLKNHTLKFTEKLKAASFGNSAEYAISDTIGEENITITLDFEKLSFNMYQQQPEE